MSLSLYLTLLSLLVLSTPIVAPPPIKHDTDVLMVTSFRNPNPYDLMISQIIESFGYKVDYVGEKDLSKIDVSTPPIVWISESVFSVVVNTFFRFDTRPIVVCESFLYDDMGMTGNANFQDFGFESGTDIQYLDEDGNVSETRPLYSSSGSQINYGVPGSAAINYAVDPNKGFRSFLFAYPPNTIAPGVGTRVGCPLYRGNGWNTHDFNRFNRTTAEDLIRRILNIAQAPSPPRVTIKVDQPGVIFTDASQNEILNFHASDQFGNVKDISALDVKWHNTNPTDVSIVPKSDTSVSISSLTDVGYTVLVARSETNSSIISEPIRVTIVKLKNKVHVVQPFDILFPYRGVAPGVGLLDLGGYELSRGDIQIGGFSLTEVLKRYRVIKLASKKKIGTVPRVNFPVVVRTSALPRRFSYIIDGADPSISGKVVKKVRRGEWTLIELQTTQDVKLYQELKFRFRGDELESAGLLSVEPPPPRSFSIATPEEPNGTSRVILREKSSFLHPSTPSNKRVIFRSRRECTRVANIDLFALKVSRKLTRLPFIFEHDISLGKQNYFFLYGGFVAELGLRPEINLQANIDVDISCPIWRKPIEIPLGIQALTAGVLDFIVQIDPSMKLSFNLEGGPRVNAFTYLKRIDTKTFGYRYQNGRWWYSDSKLGDYNTHKSSFVPDFGMSVTGVGLGTNQIERQLANDASFGASFGPSIDIKLEAQFGGAAVSRLQNFMSLAIQDNAAYRQAVTTIDKFGVLGTLNKFGLAERPRSANLLFRGLEALQFLLDLTDVEFLTLEIPIQIVVGFDTARRVLNDADAGQWNADEQQRFNLQVEPKITLGVASIQRFFKTLTGIRTTLGAFSVELEDRPIEFAHWHKAVQATGDIQHRVTKGSGNTLAKFEAGDKLYLRVPAVYGTYTGKSFTNPKFITPKFCTVHSETPISNPRVGDLDFRGVQDRSFIFDGTIDVDSALAAYLNNDKELFFLGWNTFALSDRPVLDTAGYLNSKSGFSFTAVELETPDDIAVSGEKDKTATAGLSVINRSIKDLEPVEVVYTAKSNNGKLKITPATGTFSPNSNTPLQLSFECKKNFKGTAKVTIEAEIPMTDPEVKGSAIVSVSINCLDVDCPLGAIPNPGGPTDCACDSYAGWIVVPNTNTCQCDRNRGFQYVSSSMTCSSCSDRDATKPYYNTETQRCEACPFGAIPNPTGVTPCACDSSRGFFIVPSSSSNPDRCECASDKPQFNPSTNMCEACPMTKPRYNPTTRSCEKDCTDPSKPFFNPNSQQCEACSSTTPRFNPELRICESGCPGGTRAGGNQPFYGSFELGATSGVFTFSRTHYTIRDRMQVIYEGRILHDTGCTGGTTSVSISYVGSTTNVIVRVIPNCAGTRSTAWTFTVSCPI